MKKKFLPYFSVTGTLDELIRAEMLLVMLGYDECAMPICDYDESDTHIVAYGSIESSPFGYYIDPDCVGRITLPASDLETIERYVMEGGVG